MKMPVLSERKKMTKEELEAIVPFILEIRRREQQQEVKMLQQIKVKEEEVYCSTSDEIEEQKHFKRLEHIKLYEEELKLVNKEISEQELNLAKLQKVKVELFESFKKSLQMKHKQQLEQKKQQEQHQPQSQQSQDQEKPEHQPPVLPS